ncbi:MAG: hypothetical protein ACJ8C4_06715 [Gemmataceae bacterium]
MPADLFPAEVIEMLLDHIPSIAHHRMLARIQEAGSVTNGAQLTKTDFDVLQDLEKMGLVDPGYAGALTYPAYCWVGNNNGRRLLKRFLNGKDDHD